MHDYASDARDRQTIPWLLGLASILAAWILGRVVDAALITIPWWFDAPSVMGFYTMFYAVYDNYLWSMRVGNLLAFSDIPDLRGTWFGHVKLTRRGNPIEAEVVLHIYQTWSKIKITLEAQGSSSVSTMAAYYTHNSHYTGLKYEYYNQNRLNSGADMAPHPGTNHLRLIGSGVNRELEGDYYTGMGAGQLGELSVRYYCSEHKTRRQVMAEIASASQRIAS